MELPKIASREEWLAARLALLAEEKQLSRAQAALAAERLALPMVEIARDYVFTGPRSPAIRLTAQQRRDAIADAAMHEVALGGFDGTPAAVIALRAGGSQPDPFALLGTERSLLIAPGVWS